MVNSIRVSTGGAASVGAPVPQPSAIGPGQGDVVPKVPSAPPPSTPKPSPRFDPQKMLQQMQEVVDRLNEQMNENNRNLGFSIDRKINTFVVTVRDQNTGEVVRQIPSEVVVNVAHSLEEMRGLLFNEKL